MFKSSLCLFFLTIPLLLISGSAHAQNEERTSLHGGLMIGEQAPPVNGVSLLGEEISWADELKKGPVVVLFYRGTWCPYCSRYLKELDDAINKGNLETTVIALAPQFPEFSEEDIQKASYNYRILYDQGGYYMKAYRSVSEESMVSDYANSHPEWQKQYAVDALPVPATYIINQEGAVVDRHFDEDYKERMEISRMIEVLEELK